MMGSYLYLRSMLFSLLFVTSFYPAVTSRSTNKMTLTESSSTLSDFTSYLSPFFHSSKSSLLPRSSSTQKDFVSIQINRYGERDIRVVLGSVHLHILSVPSDTRHQLELRRTADRRHYVKSVYKKGLLRDCEFTDNASDIADFVSEFNITSFEASTKVYPIHRYGRSNKKKGKRSKPGGWNLRTSLNGYRNNQNWKNLNSQNDGDKNVSGRRSIVLDKYGTTHHGRYRRNVGYILQIPYERNESDTKSQTLKDVNYHLKPLPYAVLYNTNDMDSFKPDGKDVYLNLRINPRAETRVCRLLYRRMKRLAKYNRSRQARNHNITPYKIDNKQGLPENMDIRDLDTKLISTAQKTSMPVNSQSSDKQNTPKEATNSKTPFIHPHRHQHHKHHTSVTSPTPKYISSSRTVAPNLTVVEGHVKERQISNGSNPGGRRRSRRQLNGMLIYPGTKWCGNGNTAEAFDDLGSETAADICCREHDYCPFTIESFTRRFNLFNYRLHTLSHCECDYQ